MKTKLYTMSHDIDLLKEVDNNGAQFTAEEHAKIIEKEFSETTFKSKNSLLEKYLPNEIGKYQALNILIEQINKNNYMNILSLGSGPSVLEYLLYLSISKDKTIVSSDFDSYMVGKANQFFPEFETIVFDFFQDSLTNLEIKFDIVVFFGSIYVMDDDQFVKLLKNIKKSGVKEIIDFHAGFMDSIAIIKNLLKPIKNLLRPIKNNYKGKFHGYGRSRNDIIKLYKQAGWSISKEFSSGNYKYTAILN